MGLALLPPHTLPRSSALLTLLTLLYGLDLLDLLYYSTSMTDSTYAKCATFYPIYFNNTRAALLFPGRGLRTAKKERAGAVCRVPTETRVRSGGRSSGGQECS